MANPASNPQTNLGVIVTNTQMTPTPTLPPRRIDENARAMWKTMRDLYAAVQAGGYAYPGQRQPTYPLKGLVTNYASLPAAADAGPGSRAFITDSTVPAAGNFGAVVDGNTGGSFTVPVYVAQDPTTGFYFWYIG